MIRTPILLLVLLIPVVVATGCASPYHADRGAATGGLLGATAGAIIGHQSGHTLGGAVLGGAVGALAGNAIGSGMDEVEARNRAEIEARLGRQVAPGAVTVDDIIAMTRAGVDEEVIAQYVSYRGMAHPVHAPEMIRMQQEGVGKTVMQAAQRPPIQRAPARVSQPTYIVEEHCWGAPGYYHPYPRHYYGHHHYQPRYRRPHVGWGVSISSGH